MNVLPGGGYEQFLPVLPVLPDVLPEEIKAFRDMHDAGLFLGKFQTSFPHEVFDDGTNALFQKLFRDSCHHAIVGIPYQVHLVLDWKVLFELFLESVKGQIGKARGNPPYAERLSDERRRGIVELFCSTHMVMSNVSKLPESLPNKRRLMPKPFWRRCVVALSQRRNFWK